MSPAPRKQLRSKVATSGHAVCGGAPHSIHLGGSLRERFCNTLYLPTAVHLGSLVFSKHHVPDTLNGLRPAAGGTKRKVWPNKLSVHINRYL